MLPCLKECYRSRIGSISKSNITSSQYLPGQGEIQITFPPALLHGELPTALQTQDSHHEATAKNGKHARSPSRPGGTGSHRLRGLRRSGGDSPVQAGTASGHGHGHGGRRSSGRSALDADTRARGSRGAAGNDASSALGGGEG